MSQDVQWQEMEIPVLGMNERTDPVVMPPGQWILAHNAEFTTVSGSVRKRPGLDKVCITNATNINRLATHHEQLMIVDTEGGSAQDPRIYVPEEASGALRGIEPASPYTIERESVSADLGDSVLGDLAIVNGFTVYGLISIFAGHLIIRVKENSTGTIVNESLIYQPSLPRAQGDAPVWVRAAESHGSVLISFSIPGPISQPTIYGCVVDCTGTIPVLGPIRTIVTNEDSQASAFTCSYHDTAGSSLGIDPRWFIIYRSTVGGLPGIILELKTAVLTHGWTSIVGTNPSAFSVLEHGDYVFVNYYNKCQVGTPAPKYPAGTQSWQYAAFYSISGGLITGPNNWFTGTDLVTANDISASAGKFHSGRKSGISGSLTNPLGVVLWNSQPVRYTSSSEDYFDNRPMLRWRTTTLANVQGPAFQRRGASLWCKPWTDTTNFTYYVWVGTTGRIGSAITPGASEWTLALLRINEDGLCMLDASTAGQVLGLPVFGQGAGGVGGVSGNDIAPFSSVKDSVNFHTLVNIRYIREEELSGPQEIIARRDHLGRYSSVEFGGSTYFTGGVITEFNGSRNANLGFINPPLFNAKIVASGNGQWHTGSDPEWVAQHVFYQIVYNVVSSNGELMMSAPSDLMDVIIGTATDTVILTLEPETITRRLWSTSVLDVTSPRVVISIYRSAFPNSSTLQRVFTFDSAIYSKLTSDPASLVPIYVVDRGSDATGAGNMYIGQTVSGTAYPYTDFSANEPIYTNSGELENDLPYGGATCMCVHKDRLWIGGGDDPEVIWYSKERAADRHSEFSIQQQIRIAGERVVAMESAGDYIVVFCESGVFIISGDGPNSTADPSSGTFSVPFQISPIGCIQPRSAVYVPMGIIYRSVRGIHMVNFERTVVWIGQPVQNTVDAYPDVLAAIVVPEKTQVRFAVANAERSDGRVLVYDWEEDRWAVWKYSNFVVADMKAWDNHNTAVLSTTGTLYTENYTKFIDDTIPYGMILETGWISFGRIQGFKRIRKFGLLLEKLGTHGITISMYFNYRDDFGAPLNVIKTFTPTEIANISAPEWLRITAPYQKQPSIKLIIAEIPDPEQFNSAGFVLKSMAFEVGMVPGIKRLPANQSK